MLSKEDFQKHRKVAKGDFIWKAWYKEMCLKTLVRKACKLHFADVFDNMNEEDNKHSDLDIPLNLELDYKIEIDSLNTMDELLEYYNKNKKDKKGKGKEFMEYLTIRKKQLIKLQNENT